MEDKATDKNPKRQNGKTQQNGGFKMATKSKTTEKTVVNRTKGTRKTVDAVETEKINLPSGIKETTYTKARKAVVELTVIGKKVWGLWLDIGECLYEAKQAMPATKEFGAWAQEHFPEIHNSYRSQALLAYVHRDTLNDWREKTDNLTINNPHTVINKYRKDTNIRLKPDGTTEKLKKAESTPTEKETETAGKGIAGIIEGLRLAINRTIKTLPNMKGEHITEVIDMVHTFNRALREQYPDHKPNLTELDKLNETIQKIRDSKKAA